MRFFSFRGRCFIRASFYFLAAVSVASAAATNNADDYLLQTWQSENGLPYQVVNNVLQDRDGYIWLATQGALVRFDGVRFKEYSSPLIGNERAFNIRAMIQEDESTLLMAPDVGGLVRLRDGKFTPHPASKDLAPEHISTLFAERGGALWIGYYGGDLVRWEKGKMKSFGTSDGLKAGQWSSLAYDSSGRLWVANGTFLGCYTNGTLARVADNLGDRICITPGRSGGIWIASNTRLWRWENGKLSLVSRSPPWAGVPRVRAMFEDRNGNLWIGTSARGLFRFSSGKFQPVATSHPSINAICEDHERNLWVATHGGGLNRLRPRIFQIHDKKTGLLDNISYSVCEGSRGDLWIGNCDGGLARLHGDQLEILTERTNWPRLRVFSVCADSHRGVWIGTRTGLYFWQSDSNEIPREMETNVLRDIHVLYRDQNGDVWVGADPGVLGFFHNGTFKRYTAPDGFPDENVRAIEEDKSGRVWVGTEDGNLFERIGEKFVRFGVSDGLPGSAIRAMWSDSQGVIWIGTSGGGLIAREGNRFKRITKTQGLPDNSIFQILVDDRDRVWFGSPRGIFHIGRDELLDCIEGRDDRVHAVLFGRSDGLPSVSSVAIYQPTAWKTSKGQLWFATRQGLLEVDTPAERINTRPPPVFIDECLLEDHEIPLSEPVKIPPGRRKLEIRYSVLSYTAPEEVQIRYRLEGFDSDWVEAGSQRRAVFPQLPPGNYRFRVIASNNDGFWNRAGASLAFKVLPAWWQTIFFRVTAATLFAALVGAIVLYVSHRRLKSRLERFEQQQALERERARIARDLHDDLGARLTQISLLAEMTCRDSMPPERVRKNSAQLVVRARGLVRELDGILWTVNPKNDSLDKLAAYLCRFSEQFFHLTSISCRFDVAEEIPAHPLTPETRHDLLLAVKEAMNNIVKHSGATEVWLRMRMNDGGFEITIEDNGHGFKASADSDRNGLQNMRSRIESVGGNFELQSEMGEGTVIRIKLPLKRGRDGFLNRKFKTNA